MNIRTLDHSQPHSDYGGWLGFLKTCETRRWEYGVIYYGYTNCNYILFPDGTLIENYAFHGDALMRQIAEEGQDVVLANIKRAHQELIDATNGLATAINGLTDAFVAARHTRNKCRR